jgi:hypothetical protein
MAIFLFLCHTKHRHVHRSPVSLIIKKEQLSLLVDPVELALLVADNLTLLEPESDLLLGVLDAVGAVADVAADVLNKLINRPYTWKSYDTYNGEVTTDGARGRGKRVGGTEESCKIREYNISCKLFGGSRTAASLDGVTTFPDHSADGAAQHV